MPVIPFPDGLEGSERLPHTRRSLTNCFNNGEGQIISRPGIEQLNTTGLVARGQFVWNGNLYQVASQRLLKITDTETGAFSDIGEITGNANIVTAVGFNTAVILVPGGAIYTLDNADTVVLISGNANFVPSDSVAHIDGRFVYIPTDGDPAYFSDVGAAGTVQGVSFFDAEELPDKNEVTFNLNNTLYIGGTDSFELFRDTGASPNPFQRLTGARISAGFIGGLIEYNRTFFFIGRLKGQGFGIFAIGQGEAPKISNTTIDLLLAGYTEAELARAVGSRFVWRGYDIVTFTLARDSFGFFNGEWFLLDTRVNDNPTVWTGGFITQLGGEYFTAFGENIGKLVRSNDDYGNSISRIIDIGFEQADGDYFTCQTLGMDISQGFLPAGGVENYLFQTILGAELSGDVIFNNPSYWTFIGAPITVSGGTATWVSGANGSHIRQEDFDADPGVEYEVVVDIASITGGSIGASGVGPPDEGDIYYTTPGIHTRRMTFAAGGNFRLRAGAGGTSAVVNFWSVKPVLSEGFFGGADRTVGLFMSRDNVLYGNGVFREVGRVGQYSQHLEWNPPGGLGMYQGFMGIRIYTTQDVDFSVDKMFAAFR